MNPKSILKTKQTGQPNNVRFSNIIRSSSSSELNKNINFNEATDWREAHSTGENNPYIGFSTPGTNDFQDSESIKDRSDATFSRSLAIADNNDRLQRFNSKVSTLDLFEKNTNKYPNMSKDEIIEMTEHQVGLRPKLLPPRIPYEDYPQVATPYTTSKKIYGTPISSRVGNTQWDETVKKVKFLEENKNNPYDNQDSTTFFGIGLGGKKYKSKKTRKTRKIRKSIKSRRSKKSRKYKISRKNRKLSSN